MEKKEDSFYELTVPNIHGHKYRFCGVDGGYFHPKTGYRDKDGNPTTVERAFPEWRFVDHATGFEGKYLGGGEFDNPKTY